MNANTFARVVVFCAMGLVAATGAQAKGSLGIGLTIVSSCAVSSADAYRAASSKAATVAGSGTAMVAGCTNDTNYTVSLSSGAKTESRASEAQAGRQAEAGQAYADEGLVVVTLTY